MLPSDPIRLRHMLAASREAVGFAAGRSRGDLDRDRQLTLALVKCLEIVGEAAYALSEETRGTLPEVPWPDIIGMRHRLIHAYFDVSLDIVWKTVSEELPPLIEQLEAAPSDLADPR